MDLSRYGSAGRALLTDVLTQLAEDDLQPDARDRALLDAAARLADRMHDLRGMVDREGASATSPTGIIRLHPAIAEHRNTAVALTKVLSGVSFHAEAVRSPVKQRAAQTRWRAHNAAKAGA